MPLTVVYLDDYEGKKKGTRARMLARDFMPLKRKGIVKRVPTMAADLIIKKQVHEKSLENLKKAKKPAKKVEK